jgi:hypothetical protein
MVQTSYLRYHIVNTKIQQASGPVKGRLQYPAVDGGLNPLEGFFQSAVHEVGVDLGGGDVPVPQGALNDQQVVGGAVQVGGKSVPQPMRRQVLIDAGLFQPVADPV